MLMVRKCLKTIDDIFKCVFMGDELFKFVYLLCLFVEINIVANNIMY